MNRRPKIIERVLDGFGDVLIYGALVVGLLFVVTHFILGWEINPVYGSGMGAALDSGDLVIVTDVDPKDIAVDDTIIYHSPLNGTITAHRVIRVHMLDDQPVFRTQGDGNEQPDPYLVPAENVIGFAGLTIPGLGHLVSFVKTPLGFMALIGFPGLALTAVQMREMFSGVHEEKIRRRARWSTGLKKKDWL